MHYEIYAYITLSMIIPQDIKLQLVLNTLLQLVSLSTESSRQVLITILCYDNIFTKHSLTCFAFICIFLQEYLGNVSHYSRWSSSIVVRLQFYIYLTCIEIPKVLAVTLVWAFCRSLAKCLNL